MLSREFVGSLGDSGSPPLQRVIYNPVCYKTFRAGARIRLWPTAELLDHHISSLIECKLEKYTMDVSIHHEKKANHAHTLVFWVCLFYLFKYVSLVVMWRACMFTFKCLYGKRTGSTNLRGAPWRVHLHYKSQLHSIICLPVWADGNLI